MRKIFGYEPALILGVASAVLSLLVTLGVGLTTDQAGAVVAVISGAFAAVTAAVTRPVAPSVFTGFVTVLAACLGAFHYDVAPETVGAVNTVLVAVLTLLTRGQVSPKAPTGPAVSRPGGAF